MQDRKYYENKFAGLQDLVTTTEASLMLGGISVHTVLALIWRSEIKAFRNGNQYMIPKICVIDYLLSDNYQDLMKRSMAPKKTKKIEMDQKSYQKKLLSFCTVPRSRKEMMAFLDITSPKLFYRFALNPLLETGELHRTIKSRECISTQKYIRELSVFNHTEAQE